MCFEWEVDFESIIACWLVDTLFPSTTGYWVNGVYGTPPKFNIEPENDGFQEESLGLSPLPVIVEMKVYRDSLLKM